MSRPLTPEERNKQKRNRVFGFMDAIASPFIDYNPVINPNATPNIASAYKRMIDSLPKQDFISPQQADIKRHNVTDQRAWEARQAGRGVVPGTARQAGGGVPDSAPATATGAALPPNTPGDRGPRTVNDLPNVSTQPHNNLLTDTEGRANRANMSATDRGTAWDTADAYAVVNRLDEDDYNAIRAQTDPDELIAISTDTLMDTLDEANLGLTPAQEAAFQAGIGPAMRDWYAQRKAKNQTTDVTDYYMAMTQLALTIRSNPQYQTSLPGQQGSLSTGTGASQASTPQAIPPTPAAGTTLPSGVNPIREGNTLSADELPAAGEGVFAQGAGPLGSIDMYNAYTQWALSQPNGIDNSPEGFMYAYGMGG